METVQDFEDLLALFDRFDVRSLIVGGLAFIFHAKPRYTQGMDLWLDPDPGNVQRANQALEAFRSPELMAVESPDEILQLGVAPNRIDLLRGVEAVGFAEAWSRRIRTHYGSAPANWIDLDSLIAIKSAIDHPRHREDVRVLEAVRRRKNT